MWHGYSLLVARRVLHRSRRSERRTAYHPRCRASSITSSKVQKESRELVAGVWAWKSRPFHHNKPKADEAEWFANTSQWKRLDSRLIQAVIERLHADPIVEVFVHASQTAVSLVSSSRPSSCSIAWLCYCGVPPRWQILSVLLAPDKARASRRSCSENCTANAMNA